MALSFNGFSTRGIGRLVTTADIAESKLNLSEYFIESFFGGISISLGGLMDFVIVADPPGLRSSNAGIATLLGGFLFPLGFVLLTSTNLELCTSNMFVMPFAALQRKITVWDCAMFWIAIRQLRMLRARQGADSMCSGPSSFRAWCRLYPFRGSDGIHDFALCRLCLDVVHSQGA